MKKNLTIVISAGPTQEPIDPVRFISNHSTGRVGYEVAKEALKRRHKVILISGPTRLLPPKGARVVHVTTALQMKEALERFFGEADCFIMAAAVSDYRPQRAAKQKIKKAKKTLTLRLVKNPDILSGLALQKRRKLLVGFCLETQDLLARALTKLKKKNLDIIVANRFSKTNDPFGNSKADFLLIDRNRRVITMRRASKKNLAKRLIDNIEVLTNCALTKDKV
ncbi:MAG: phosphopantothenoylcysteine decarboxylase [Candidatus Omnitrophota bacterium]